MQSSDDDVVVIDSSSASYANPPGALTHPNSSGDSEQFTTDGDAEGDDEVQPTRGAAGASIAALHRRTPYDAACHRLQEGLRSLPSMRMEVDTQTDTSVSGETAAALYQHLTELHSALGIRLAMPAAAPTDCRSSIDRLIASWREGGRAWKRPRHDVLVSPNRESEEESGTAASKCINKEGVRSYSGAASDTSLPPSSAPPVWVEELSAALQQCQRLLQSAVVTEARQRGGGDDATIRARLVSLPVEPPTTASSAPPPSSGLTPFPRSERAAQGGADSRTDTFSSEAPLSSLLREAEVICTREHISSLQPLYTELRTLRRQRAQKWQEQTQSVARELQWEQRLLSTVLTECEAQLDAMNTNFIECCRGNLAPLDALQRRMQSLQAFQRQIHAAGGVTTPILSVQASSQTLPNTQVRSAAAAALPVEHTPRVLGKAAEALTKHLEEERLRLQADLDAARAQLKEQGKQIADLQACYAHATAQVQHALDAEHYVKKDAIKALKQQQQEALAMLAHQFGWTLVNSTPDVLSLQHPRTGEVLHANHTYATINGKPCGDVAKALAEYVLRHAAVESPAAASDAGKAVGSGTQREQEKTSDSDEGRASFDAAALPPSAPTLSSEDENDVLPPVPTTDAEESPQGEDDHRVAAEYCDTEGEESAGEQEQVMAPSASSPVVPMRAEVKPPTAVEFDGVHTATHQSSNAEAMSDSKDVKQVDGADASGSHGGAEAERGEVHVPAGKLQANDAEGAEEEEVFVNYSNLQSDEMASSRQDDSGAVNSSAEYATTKAPLQGGATHDREQADVYTGFFTENALWEDDS
ncbi:hypothetical protein ABL78_1995 [Leptomonas seymouri]|uniref:Uncharacterized protein n=1 Tax=Leptomonas seymouri TaxID=5684 RepID=A0A0N1I6M7_LEPSE|nr:hypothetical protein ABL78_1995 [Leptomonas seymouri]|eukprot:KPI88878.1 hypothetical protein ABL78_1995 [Leptomonas seymouri]